MSESQRIGEPQRIGRFLTATRRPGGWHVTNTRRVFLGTIEMVPQWRQHVFVPVVGAVFSWDCLRDLSAFVHQVDIETVGAKAVDDAPPREPERLP